MSTVVGEVSVKVPEPLPLKGVEWVAKAAGNALRTARRAKTLRITNFMTSLSTPKSSYKGSFLESNLRSLWMEPKRSS
jgi:hypothetical protein